MTMEGTPPVNEFPSEPAVKRSKFLWRVFLISNFALCAYILANGSRKVKGKEKKEIPAEVPPTPPAATVPPQEEPNQPIISPPIPKPVIVRQPIPKTQQRELFQWMLEEKRKVKPQSREEKKRIDEEKALLKSFLRAESIPKI